MDKYTKSDVKNAEKSAKTLSKIGIYNEKVRDTLKSTPIEKDPILAITIKNFIDSAQRRNLTELAYNIEVEAFNKLHGFFLLKKGQETENRNYYSYLNYPFISKDDQKETCINFKKYKEDYNKKVLRENAEICIYNAEEVKNDANLTPKEKKAKKEFLEDYSFLDVWEFNKRVEEENLCNPIHHKKKIQKLKQAHVNTFRVLLYFYVGQLKFRNCDLLNKGRTTRVEKSKLPPLQVNKRNLVIHKIDGLRELDYTEKTIYNHINRLLEAGVFHSYRFYHHTMPTSIRFNREILVISDDFPPKTQKTDNQLVSGDSEKKLPNYIHNTRSRYKEIEIKNCVIEHSNNKCGSGVENQNESNSENPAEAYKKHEVDNKLLKLEGGEKIEIPSFVRKNTHRNSVVIAKNFLAKHIPDNKLDELLRVNTFKSYKPLPFSYLQRVRSRTIGDLSKEDFKKILIQDFIKTSAKIWKNHKVYPGTWYNAIEGLNDTLFKNLVEKESVENKLREYRWKIEWSRKFFNNSNVTALFPSDYFDSTRKNKNEIGFFSNYLHKKWLESKSKEGKNKKNKALESSKRKKRLKNFKYDNNLKKAIEKYNSGKYNYKQLSDYVCDNLPKKYIAEFLKLSIKKPNND